MPIGAGRVVFEGTRTPLGGLKRSARAQTLEVQGGAHSAFSGKEIPAIVTGL